MNNKMVITVSDTNGIKQYTAPKSIKKILLFALLFILLFIGGLFYYIQSLTSQVTGLESNNETLTEQMQKDSTMREAFEEKQLELDTIKKEKLEVETKLEQEKIVLEKKLQEKIKQLVTENEKIENQNKITHEEKSESDKLLDELTKEIKQIEKELEEEIKIKESLRKKLSLKIKREKTKKEKVRKAKLAKKEKAKKEKLAKKEKAKKDKLAKKEKEHKDKLTKRKLKREDLLRRIAKTKLGKRYVWGAVGPRTFDCSGFTSYVYKKTGVNIPRTSREQSKYGKYIKRKALKPGDLIFFDTSRRKKGIVNHVGIYLGNNKFIHASSAKKRVVVTSLGKPFYSSRYKWARRVVN